MAQSPATAATMDGELVNPEGAQEAKNTSHLVAITAATPYGEPWGYENTGCWPQIAEAHMKGMISVSPASCIFPYIEKY